MSKDQARQHGYELKQLVTRAQNDIITCHYPSINGITVYTCIHTLLLYVKHITVTTMINQWTVKGLLFIEM